MTDFSKKLIERAQNIRLLICDIDGVLTDGHICLDYEGRELKFFHAHDGLGIKALQAAGIQVAIISSRESTPVEHRMKALGVELVFQGAKQKKPAYEKIKTTLSLKDDEIAYIGDDWPDIPVMKQVGLAVAVANATQAVQETAHWTTSRPGGQGAVRELAEQLLIAQEKLGAVFEAYR